MQEELPVASKAQDQAVSSGGSTNELRVSVSEEVPPQPQLPPLQLKRSTDAVLFESEDSSALLPIQGNCVPVSILAECAGRDQTKEVSQLRNKVAESASLTSCYRVSRYHHTLNSKTSSISGYVLMQ